MTIGLIASLVLLLSACADAGSQDTTLVVSSDSELRALVGELLPELSRRSGLDLREPVRVERRSRASLESYLRAKLDEELPPVEAEHITRAYALLGLVPPDLDLRGLLLSVYGEQVAGFYDPDSAAVFVLDDQPAELMMPLLIHELVHAVQDQATDLDSITHKSRGNDRQTAAQAAIEGHATLVMLEYMMAQLPGSEVDLSRVGDFTTQVRPALEALRAQYPALASAPRVVQEAMLFPYVEGAGFVQALWSSQGGRPAPFGAGLPQSTEQILDPSRMLSEDAADPPIDVVLSPASGSVLFSDVLGALETGILLEEVSGSSRAGPLQGWGGDRYALIESGDGVGLAWGSVWDDPGSRDRFVGQIQEALDRFLLPTTVEAIDVGDLPGALVRIGPVGAVEVTSRDG